MSHSHILSVGAAAVDITPSTTQFLSGYAHVSRYSTGVHDRLMSSALYLHDGTTEALFIANDVICVPKAMVARVRERIELRTAIPASHIMITATHTHSGPMVVGGLLSGSDPETLQPDPAYLEMLEDGMVAAAELARQRANPGRIGLAVAVCPDIGTNRRDPGGPSNPRVPVLLACTLTDETPVAAMFVSSMHPTVLHGDSTLISGDFPAMARQYLQRHVLDPCPILIHTGPSGNLSPRHVTRANTFEEAERLGTLLGRAIEQALQRIELQAQVRIRHQRALVDLPPKPIPPVAEAARRLVKARARLEALRRARAPREIVRTAEVDWLGAEACVALARAAETGRLEGARKACMPAQIQVIQVGPWRFVGWPGEVFVEYGLRVEHQVPQSFVISLANGELQGYIATPEAAREGGYEAVYGLFAPESGAILVARTLNLLSEMA